MTTTITRYHDISAGHRVAGHENKCSQLHGHNYRVHFTCVADGLDVVGRVVDFGVVKTLLCQWLEDNWDHKFLVWEGDPLWLDGLMATLPGVEVVGFNPTAENMAEYLVNIVGPMLFRDCPGGVALHSVTIDETRKCSATYTREHSISATGRHLPLPEDH